MLIKIRVSEITPDKSKVPPMVVTSKGFKEYEFSDFNDFWNADESIVPGIFSHRADVEVTLTLAEVPHLDKVAALTSQWGQMGLTTFSTEWQDGNLQICVFNAPTADEAVELIGSVVITV